jgi:hypothetical protein
MGNAEAHHSKKLLTKSLYLLQLNVHQQFIRQMLNRQSVMFFTQHLQRKIFCVWRVRYAETSNFKKKMNIALWVWSAQLKRKCFQAWIKDMLEEKEYKSQLHEALQFRRNMLLDRGITKWIAYSSDMMRMRSQIANERQIPDVISINTRVRRFALHWLHVTRCRHLRRNTNLSSSCGKQSTTEHFKPVMPSSIVLPTGGGRSQPRKPDYLCDSYDLLHLDCERVSNKDTNTSQYISKTPLDSSATLALQLKTKILPSPQKIQSPRSKKSILMPPSSFIKRTPQKIVSSPQPNDDQKQTVQCDKKNIPSSPASLKQELISIQAELMHFNKLKEDLRIRKEKELSHSNKQADLIELENLLEKSKPVIRNLLTRVNEIKQLLAV